MKITSKILEYMLQNKQLDVCVQGDAECVLQIASLICRSNGTSNSTYLKSNQLKKGVAYVDLNKTYHIAPSAEDGYVFIVANNQQNHKYTYADELNILNITNTLLTTLNEWDLKLKDAIISNYPLSELARIGEEILDLPFCFVNKNLIILLHSQNYDSSINGKVQNTNIDKHSNNLNQITANAFKNNDDTSNMSSEFIPPNIVIDLIEEDRFEKASTKTEPFYYLSEDGMAYCINMHINNVYAARFVAILDDGEMTLHLGAEQILIHFNRYIQSLYNMLAIGNAQVSRQDDSLHQLLANISTENMITNTSTLQNSLLSYGWLIEDNYKVIWLEFIDNVSWSSAAYYMACQIESMWSNSCTIATDRGILWILNITRIPSNTNQTSFRKSYTKLLTDYVCKSGESSEFNDLCMLPRYIKEAKLSLEYGLKKDPTSWHFNFNTYAFDYIIDKSMADLIPEQICENSLLELCKIDDEKQTNYAKTLVCYLRNNCNSTHAANELFIHRTTLLHRLDKINELVSINFDDSTQKLMILLSAKMLDI